MEIYIEREIPKHLLGVTNRHSEGMNIDVGFQEWELTPLHVQKADLQSLKGAFSHSTEHDEGVFLRVSGVLMPVTGCLEAEK